MLDQLDKGLTVWPVNFSQDFSLTAPFLCNKRRTVPSELSDFKNHNRLMSAAGGTMFRVDVDAHIDESEATWEYLDDGARRFKPVTLDPGAATVPGDARPHRLWLIDGTIRLRRWRDDTRASTSRSSRVARTVPVRLCATWTSCTSTSRSCTPPCSSTLSPLDRRSTWRFASLTIAGSPKPQTRAADGCAGSPFCLCSTSTRR